MFLEDILKDGCGCYRSFEGDFDCSHGYEFSCEYCPINNINDLNKFSNSLQNKEEDELICLIDEIEAVRAAIVAEHIGNKYSSTKSVNKLIDIITDPDNYGEIIRVGAVYGLLKHLDKEYVKQTVAAQIKIEKSGWVKQIFENSSNL